LVICDWQSRRAQCESQYLHKLQITNYKLQIHYFFLAFALAAGLALADLGAVTRCGGLLSSGFTTTWRS
jgi:hypothetical protein